MTNSNTRKKHDIAQLSEAAFMALAHDMDPLNGAPVPPNMRNLDGSRSRKKTAEHHHVGAIVVETMESFMGRHRKVTV